MQPSNRLATAKPGVFPAVWLQSTDYGSTLRFSLPDPDDSITVETAMHVNLSPDLTTLLTDLREEVSLVNAKLDATLAELRSRPHAPVETKRWFAVDEVAALLGKRPYTVREWARHGQINAAKKAERRGGAALWTISAEEVSRYRNEGLLGIDTDRNNTN